MYACVYVYLCAHLGADLFVCMSVWAAAEVFDPNSGVPYWVCAQGAQPREAGMGRLKWSEKGSKVTLTS